MNWRTKRKLEYSTKIAIIIAAMVYMVTGVWNVNIQAHEENAEELNAVVGKSKTITIQKRQSKSATKWSSGNIKSEPEKENLIKPEPIELEEEEKYLLAKIAMSEAEGEDLEGKALVMNVVLNRVKSNKFPDNIKEVIFQSKNGTYQFSPLQPEGRWWTTEPNEDCWKALEMVLSEHWDKSQGALYFESESDSTWHKDNLKHLFTHGSHYFYTEEE